MYNSMSNQRRRGGGGREGEEEERKRKKKEERRRLTRSKAQKIFCNPHPPSKKLLFGAENMTEKSQLDKM